MKAAGTRAARDASAPFTTTERLIRAIARQVNVRPALKRAAHAYLRTAGANWVHFCTRHLLHVTNAEVLDTLRPDRGVIVASNHRSLADMYVVSSVLLRRCPWITRLYCPVRSEYIDDRCGGLCGDGGGACRGRSGEYLGVRLARR